MRRQGLVVAGLAILVAACGGNETTQTEPSAVPATTAATETTTTVPLVEMTVTSPAFEEQGTIPVEFTCDGENVSPPLEINDIPDGTVALVLIIDDPDAPAGIWDHWVEYDIAPTAEIPRAAGSIGTAGLNSWGTTGYGGPCPPSGTHRYVHQAYALDAESGLAGGATKDEVLAAIEGHVLASAELTGLYAR